MRMLKLFEELITGYSTACSYPVLRFDAAQCVPRSLVITKPLSPTVPRYVRAVLSVRQWYPTEGQQH